VGGQFALDGVGFQQVAGDAMVGGPAGRHLGVEREQRGEVLAAVADDDGLA
jgi:hypothetical protein